MFTAVEALYFLFTSEHHRPLRFPSATTTLDPSPSAVPSPIYFSIAHLTHNHPPRLHPDFRQMAESHTGACVRVRYRGGSAAGVEAPVRFKT